MSERIPLPHDSDAGCRDYGRGKASLSLEIRNGPRMVAKGYGLTSEEMAAALAEEARHLPPVVPDKWPSAELVDVDKDDFAEAARLLREGDTEALAAFASRNVRQRAEEAARAAASPSGTEEALRVRVRELEDALKMRAWDLVGATERVEFALHNALRDHGSNLNRLDPHEFEVVAMKLAEAALSMEGKEPNG